MLDKPLVEKYEWIEDLEEPERPDGMSQQIHIEAEEERLKEKFEKYVG